MGGAGVREMAAELARLHAELRAAGATVAVAESLTGGLVCAALTSTPGASLTMRGGLVVYATDLKGSLAGVSAGLLAERGAVDPDVARELASGVRTRLNATIGLGVTGVAGPDPQDGVAVGTVYIGVSVDGSGGVAESVSERHFSGDREAIREQSVLACVSALQAAVAAIR